MANIGYSTNRSIMTSTFEPKNRKQREYDLVGNAVNDPVVKTVGYRMGWEEGEYVENLVSYPTTIKDWRSIDSQYTSNSDEKDYWYAIENPINVKITNLRDAEAYKENNVAISPVVRLKKGTYFADINGNDNELQIKAVKIENGSWTIIPLVKKSKKNVEFISPLIVSSNAEEEEEYFFLVWNATNDISDSYTSGGTEYYYRTFTDLPITFAVYRSDWYCELDSTNKVIKAYKQKIGTEKEEVEVKSIEKKVKAYTPIYTYSGGGSSITITFSELPTLSANESYKIYPINIKKGLKRGGNPRSVYSTPGGSRIYSIRNNTVGLKDPYRVIWNENLYTINPNNHRQVLGTSKEVSSLHLEIEPIEIKADGTTENINGVLQKLANLTATTSDYKKTQFAWQVVLYKGGVEVAASSISEPTTLDRRCNGCATGYSLDGKEIKSAFDGVNISPYLDGIKIEGDTDIKVEQIIVEQVEQTKVRQVQKVDMVNGYYKSSTQENFSTYKITKNNTHVMYYKYVN